jgi:glycerol-3-phosphate dehydrogenase
MSPLYASVITSIQELLRGDHFHNTSSRSTKLVHGGLRYLKQAQIKVVAETGKERAIV